MTVKKKIRFLAQLLVYAVINGLRKHANYLEDELGTEKNKASGNKEATGQPIGEPQFFFMTRWPVLCPPPPALNSTASLIRLAFL